MLSDCGFSNKTVLEIIAEAGGMRGVQSDVLVKVEHFDFFPVDAGKTGQSFEKLELRGACGSNDACLSMVCEGAANRNRGLLRSSDGKCALITKELQDHNR